ncbi:DUF6542 domain-containing protein [Streptacidiphilus melanogenes]|uniref:DUF6542 domain-containing protein n=1 Tax=Streptacidiphilus melanogenes TaxID=411235 RepID=UPI000693FF22|nr:DUF6542 domain-containing protein [Streptacidiphilus melanogenes]
MTGQSTQRQAARSPERTAQPPNQRGLQGRSDGRADGHGHGQAHGQSYSPGDRPVPERGGSGRGGRLARPQASWVLLGLPVLGALVDEVSGAQLGSRFFLVCSVLASAWAALLVTRRGLWWVLPSPPLVIAAVAFLDQVLLHRSDFAGDKFGTGVLKCAVEVFPAMLFALLAAFAAPALRRVLTRHLAGRAAGRAAQVPVPRRSHHG